MTIREKCITEVGDKYYELYDKRRKINRRRIY